MTLTQIEQYLNRIGLKGPLAPDAKNLALIQRQHLLTVPYENLDILAGADMPLTEKALFDKIVTRHRGGYCFELNGLLGMLLTGLGYEVEDYFARFLKNEPLLPMRRHRVLVVKAEGLPYLVDVGVGLPIPQEPLVLQEGEQGVYALRKEPFLGWVLYDRGRQLYSFTEEPQIPIDYEAAHYWCRFAPQSPFTHEPMLAIRTLQGRITMDGNVLRFFLPQGVEEQVCDEKEQLRSFKEYFGICLEPS